MARTDPEAIYCRSSSAGAQGHERERVSGCVVAICAQRRTQKAGGWGGSRGPGQPPLRRPAQPHKPRSGATKPGLAHPYEAPTRP